MMGLFGLSSLATTAIGAVVIAAVAAGGGAWTMHRFDEGKIEAMQLADAKAQNDALVRNGQIMQSAIANGFKIASAEVAREQKTQTVTNTIIREVPAHVTPEIDKRYPVPWSVVRLHDAAALGLSVADIAADRSGADDAASDVAASEISSRIAENYGACRLAYERVDALEQDDAMVRGLFASKPPTK